MSQPRIATPQQRKPLSMILEYIELRAARIQRSARGCRPDELAEIEELAGEIVRVVRAARASQ